jgi:hypothetical protein
MRDNGKSLALLLAAAATVATFVAPATEASDSPTAREQMIAARQEWLASGQSIPKRPGPHFGTAAASAVNVHAYEFQGTDPYGDQISDDGNGFRYFRAAGSDFLAAPVRLPSGVVIDSVEMSSCIATDGDLFLGLFDGGYGVSGGGNVTYVSTLEGCGVDGTYGINYQYDVNHGHPLYLLLLWGSRYDGATKFNDVTIHYHQKVSPAPQSATFLDVPTNHGFFQYVEALAASGITAGCGNNNFCPDNAVTRGQMAVFIARALGLHWPN